MQTHRASRYSETTDPEINAFRESRVSFRFEEEEEEDGFSLAKI